MFEGEEKVRSFRFASQTTASARSRALNRCASVRSSRLRACSCEFDHPFPDGGGEADDGDADQSEHSRYDKADPRPPLQLAPDDRQRLVGAGSIFLFEVAVSVRLEHRQRVGEARLLAQRKCPCFHFDEGVIGVRGLGDCAFCLLSAADQRPLQGRIENRDVRIIALLPSRIAGRRSDHCRHGQNFVEPKLPRLSLRGSH